MEGNVKLWDFQTRRVSKGEREERGWCFLFVYPAHITTTIIITAAHHYHRHHLHDAPVGNEWSAPSPCHRVICHHHYHHRHNH
jgi:hypothetical protein